MAAWVSERMLIRIGERIYAWTDERLEAKSGMVMRAIGWKLS